MYFNVIVGTSTAQAGLPLSLCGGLGLALGSLLAGQYASRHIGSRKMLTTALLYTVRTLGVALGVSIGGSIQIGALTSNLKRAFRDHPDRDKVSSRDWLRATPE
jgi:hypothetical protein